MVIIDRKHLKEMYSADEDTMQFLPAAVEDSDFSCAFRADVFKRVHSRAIRLNLNHNIPVYMPELVNELIAAFDEEFESVKESKTLFRLSDRSLDACSSL